MHTHHSLSLLDALSFCAGASAGREEGARGVSVCVWGGGGGGGGKGGGGEGVGGGGAGGVGRGRGEGGWTQETVG